MSVCLSSGKRKPCHTLCARVCVCRVVCRVVGGLDNIALEQQHALQRYASSYFLTVTPSSWDGKRRGTPPHTLSTNGSESIREEERSTNTDARRTTTHARPIVTQPSGRQRRMGRETVSLLLAPRARGRSSGPARAQGGKGRLVRRRLPRRTRHLGRGVQVGR